MLHTVFGALADPTRFAIVEQLLEKGELTAGELAEPFEVSRPAISRHLKILEEAGVIERRIERQFRVFRARAEGFREIEDWFERHRQFWNASFDRLQELVEKGNPDDRRKDRRPHPVDLAADQDKPGGAVRRLDRSAPAAQMVGTGRHDDTRIHVRGEGRRSLEDDDGERGRRRPGRAQASTPCSTGRGGSA